MLTCSLAEVDTLAEVVEMTVTAWGGSSRVQEAMLRIEAGEGEPGVGVLTGTAQAPIMAVAVCTKTEPVSQSPVLSQTRRALSLQ